MQVVQRQGPGPEPGRTAQATENPDAGGTPGEHSETGGTEGGITAAMAGGANYSNQDARDSRDGSVEP